MNTIKTGLLLAALTALVLVLGFAMAGATGLAIAVILGVAMNFGAYWFSDKIVLRLYRAVPMTADTHPELHAMLADLSARAAIPTPRLFLIPEEAPNAFATGRSPAHAAVAVTEGLLRALPREEIRGVLAHEIAHVMNRDTLVMCVSAAIAGAMSTVANIVAVNALFGAADDEENTTDPIGGILGIIIAPILATMIQLAISRSREFQADATAAELTGDPRALASALRSLEVWKPAAPMHSATAATAHLFISNPLSGAGLLRLFSTHPPTDARVARLERMAIQAPLERAAAAA